ncbi:MAG: hypothetical protein U1A78_04555 [Polyangia bacterium]
MAEKKKGLGNTLLGLFVVREDEGGDEGVAAESAKASSDATVDDLIARYAGGPATTRAGSRPPPLPTGAAGAKRTPTRPPGAPAAAPGGASAAASSAAAPAVEEAAAPEGGDVPDVKVDFPDVLRRGGLSNDEQGRVDRALTLLHALPAETPVEIKRQIVGASLQAFGIPVEQIIESAALHLYAYDRHVKEGQAQTQALLEQSNRRLAELEQEVARVKLVMQEQLTQQRGLTAACNKQKLRVQEVLTFFGEEALNKVAQTSPKLRDKMNER